MAGRVGELPSGGERGYRLHVPAGHDPNRATPLVLSFHGYAKGAAEQEAFSGLLPWQFFQAHPKK